MNKTAYNVTFDLSVIDLTLLQFIFVKVNITLNNTITFPIYNQRIHQYLNT